MDAIDPFFANFGKNENPGIKTVERLAKVLKVPIGKLIK